jgi:hypothetical protein
MSDRATISEVAEIVATQKARRRRNRPEQALQRAIVQHLETRPAPGIFWCHYPAGGARRPIEAKIFRGLGLKAGVPDLLLCRAGKLIAIELKSPTGRLSKHQRATIAELTAAGCLVRVIDNIDGAVAWLEKLGFLRGEMQ